MPEGLDWERWCGPGPLVPYHPDIYAPRANPGWISFRPWSGGEVTGWGAHGFDQIQTALGMDESGPVELWTDGAKFAPPTFTAPEGRDRADKICCVPRVFFRYATGVEVEMTGEPVGGRISGGRISGGRISGGGIFVGEKGRIRIDRGICRSEPDEELAENAVRAARDQGGDHIQNWYDCIRSRQRPRADIEFGHRTATLCHLVNIARWTGRRLRWDPVKEEFIGDPVANAYLDALAKACVAFGRLIARVWEQPIEIIRAVIEYMKVAIRAVGELAQAMVLLAQGRFGEAKDKAKAAGVEIAGAMKALASSVLSSFGETGDALLDAFTAPYEGAARTVETFIEEGKTGFEELQRAFMSIWFPPSLPSTPVAGRGTDLELDPADDRRQQIARE